MTPRPDRIFDPGGQHERTALAWERTAVALMVAGGLLLKHAIDSDAAWAEVLGLLGVTAGAGLLLWAARRYESLHGVLRSEADVIHPTMLRTVALTTVVLTVGAIALVVIAP